MKLHRLSNAQWQKMEKYLGETNRMGKHDLDDILMPYFIAKNRLVQMVPEKIFSWHGNFRGLSKDFEFLLESSQAMLYLVSIKLF